MAADSRLTRPSGWPRPILAVIARMTMGFSLGGEIGSNTAYLAEAAAPEKRGFVVSWQPVGQAIAVTMRRSGRPCRDDLAAGRRRRCLWLAGGIPARCGHGALWPVAALQSSRDAAELRSAAPQGATPRSRGWCRRASTGGSSSSAWRTSPRARSAPTSSTTSPPTPRRRCICPRASASLPRPAAICSASPSSLAAAGFPTATGAGRSTSYGNLAFLVLIYPTFAWDRGLAQRIGLHGRHDPAQRGVLDQRFLRQPGREHSRSPSAAAASASPIRWPWCSSVERRS